MMDMQPERDDDRFQEVLGRLDALVKRGHQDDEPPPPPAVSEATIPMLTDVYRPAHEEAFNQLSLSESSWSFDESAAKSLDQVVSEVLPEVITLLEDALVQQIRPALNVALDAVIVDLRPQIEERLRQHLLQALAKK